MSQVSTASNGHIQDRSSDCLSAANDGSGPKAPRYVLAEFGLPTEPKLSYNLLDPNDNRSILQNLVGHAAARRLLENYHNLSDISRASNDALEQLDLNIREIIALRSAFALSRRLAVEVYAESPLLDKPSRIADLLREENRSFDVEHLQVVLLNVKRHLIAVKTVAIGSTEEILISPRDVLFPAISSRAWGLVLVHNHPSGDPTPSRADIETTHRMIAAGKLVGIEVIDHLILGHRTESRPRDYVSLRELLGF